MPIRGLVADKNRGPRGVSHSGSMQELAKRNLGASFYLAGSLTTGSVGAEDFNWTRQKSVQHFDKIVEDMCL